MEHKVTIRELRASLLEAHPGIKNLKVTWLHRLRKTIYPTGYSDYVGTVSIQGDGFRACRRDVHQKLGSFSKFGNWSMY